MGRRIRGRTRLSKIGSTRILMALYWPAIAALRCHPLIANSMNVEPVTSGEDLKVAKMQAEAMARAKQLLRAVVDKAVNANQGFRAVSVTPTLTEGHPVAEVTLVKDDTVKTVAERLDE
jgi:hypothetical protein